MRPNIGHRALTLVRPSETYDCMEAIIASGNLAMDMEARLLWNETRRAQQVGR